MTKNEETIFRYLTKTMGLNCAAACGVLANFEAESAFKPNNLQNSCEKKLGYTDDTYTVAVDDGAYKSFAKDAAGYGLAQWTYHTRKQKLLDFAKKKGKSIADLDMQLEFFAREIKGNSTVWACLKTVGNNAHGAYKAGYIVCYHYEAPAEKETASVTRGNRAKSFFKKYANNPSTTDCTYTVVKGDSLWKIASKLLGKGSRYTEIKTLNGLKSNTIKIGQVLKIPAK